MTDMILIPKGLRLRLWSPSEFADIWAAYDIKAQRKRIGDYLRFLDLAEKRGLLSDLEDAADDGYFHATMHSASILQPLFELGALTMPDLIEQLAELNPDLKEYTDEDLDTDLEQYGCTITTKNNRVRFGLRTLLSDTYLAITQDYSTGD